MPTATSLTSPEFERSARLLNAQPFGDSARYHSEMMSGAVRREDESADMRHAEIGWFRMALADRSSVIVGHPRAEFEMILIALTITPKPDHVW